MEMCDPSSKQPIKDEEMTLNQPQAAPAADAAEEVLATQNLAVDPESVVETAVSEAIEANAEEQQEALPDSKASLIEAAKLMLEKDPADIQREAITRLRQHFNTLRKVEIENARTLWGRQGNPPEAFVVTDDPDEAVFNEIIAQIREKKSAWAAQQEEERKNNLAAKNEIIDQINALAADTDNVNRTFNQYLELQTRFNAIGPVPPTDETQVWKKYQEAREHYSDNLKINKELRDYDFKKNLATKLDLIEQAKALANEEDVIAAFRRLQDLHDKWRQIGPVAKEMREEIWMQFKDASAVINKKYQSFFEERKAREQQNEEAKIALCEKIEALDFTALKMFADWDQMTNQIIALQNEWKSLGFASRKVNNALFARFRQRCDEFFTAKAAYFKSVKEEYAANLAKKTALAERAEALKDSTEWRKATDEFVEMQKEWKTIGAVPKRHSDAIWKRFLAACDYFFDKKKQATSGQRSVEQANLKAKKQIIEQLKAITEDTPDADAVARLRELQEQWQQTGHVPYKDKDKINDAYRAALGALRQRLNINEGRARMERFESSLSQIEGDQGKLYRERDRLARILENRRNEMRTYENNLGFLTSKSKSGESMLAEFRRNIDKIKDDITQIKAKIDLIDQKISEQQ